MGDKYQADPVARRRKLLKAVAGASPVLLTLPSGAQAATSVLQCVARDGVFAPQPAFETTAPDTWVRQKVDVWRVTPLHTTDRVAAWLIGGQYYFRNLVSGSGVYAVGTLINIDPSKPIRKETTVSYVLVKVDSSGQLQGVYPASTAGQGVHASCWTSIQPVTGNPGSVQPNGLYTG